VKQAPNLADVLIYIFFKMAASGWSKHSKSLKLQAMMYIIEILITQRQIIIADPSAVEAVKGTEDWPTVPNIHKGMSCGENKTH